MEWLELLKWLSEAEQSEKENQALAAIAQQVQEQQVNLASLIESHNALSHNFHLFQVLALIVFFLVMCICAYGFRNLEKKIENLEKRLDA
jgi:hypothetical protein